MYVRQDGFLRELVRVVWGRQTVSSEDSEWLKRRPFSMFYSFRTTSSALWKPRRHADVIFTRLREHGASCHLQIRKRAPPVLELRRLAQAEVVAHVHVRRQLWCVLISRINLSSHTKQLDCNMIEHIAEEAARKIHA